MASVSPDQISTFFNIWSHKCPLASGTVSYWLSTSHCCPLLTLYTALSHRNAQLSLDLVSTSFHTQYSKQRVFHNNFLWWKIDTAKSRWLTLLLYTVTHVPKILSLRSCTLGWSEKYKSWKMQKYQADSEPRHSTDFRTIFGIRIGWFVSCEIGQTCFT